eukprot:4998433-Pyramimonas_sp.AAC.1
MLQGAPRDPEELRESFRGLARKAFRCVSSLLSGFWTLPRGRCQVAGSFYYPGFGRCQVAGSLRVTRRAP